MPLPCEWRHGTWRGHYARGHTTQVREAPSTESAVPGYLDSHTPQPHPSEAFRSSLSQNSLAHSTSAHCSQLHLSLICFPRTPIHQKQLQPKSFNPSSNLRTCRHKTCQYYQAACSTVHNKALAAAVACIWSSAAGSHPASATKSTSTALTYSNKHMRSINLTKLQPVCTNDKPVACVECP